jgi:hypothetical protein
MTSFSIVPILVTLLAPGLTEPASDAAAPAATEPSTEAGPEGSPEAVAPEDATPTDTAPEAATPEPVTAPILAPPPTAAIPRPPPAPTRQPRAIGWRLDFGMGLGSTVVRDLGFRAFDYRRNLLAVEPSVIFDFRLAGGRFFLGGGMTYAFARSIGFIYDLQVSSRIRLHEPRVVGRMSFMIVEGIDAFARVGVGPSVVDLDIESSVDSDGYSYKSAEQRVVLPRVDGQAGLSLYLPKKWLPFKQASRVTAGLDLAMGYTWRGKLAFEPKLVQGDDPLRATTTPLGSLALHGLSWGVGLFVRVM